MRDKFNDGYISFGNALKAGLLIALIGSTVYVAAWLVDFYCFHPDYMQKYADSVISQAKASGASLAEIDKQKAQMTTYIEMYKNPLMVIVFTYLEILPVGIVIAIIAALILKRKPQNAQGLTAA